MDMINEAGKGEKTKYRLARSMKECMKTMSVDNITVKQITENCGVGSRVPAVISGSQYPGGNQERF